MSATLSYCENEEQYPVPQNQLKYFSLSGSVTDQVSGKPLSGAKVFLAGLPFNDPSGTLKNLGPSALTASDGRFDFSVPALYFYPQEIQRTTMYPYVYAFKEGFAGSDYFSLSQGNNSVSLKLFHQSKLYLTIWNDTLTNDIDEVWFSMTGGYGSYPGSNIGRLFMTMPTINILCSGRKFKTNLEYFPLWANVNYYLLMGKSKYLGDLKEVKITLKPDSVLNYSLSF